MAASELACTRDPANLHCKSESIIKLVLLSAQKKKTSFHPSSLTAQNLQELSNQPEFLSSVQPAQNLDMLLNVTEAEKVINKL